MSELEAPYSVSACHAAGGRLVYVGERPACAVPDGVDGVNLFAIGTGEPLGAGLPVAPDGADRARRGVGVAAGLLLGLGAFLASRKRGR